jgi:hypothetical protein
MEGFLGKAKMGLLGYWIIFIMDS